MANAAITLKAETFKFGLKQLTGAVPTIEYLADGTARVYFPPGEVEKAQVWFSTMMNKTPGDISLDLAPVFKPYLLKQFLPYIIGGGIAGFIAGKIV